MSRLIRLIRAILTAWVAQAMLGGMIVQMEREEINQRRLARGKACLPSWRGPHQPSFLYAIGKLLGKKYKSKSPLSIVPAGGREIGPRTLPVQTESVTAERAKALQEK